MFTTARHDSVFYSRWIQLRSSHIIYSRWKIKSYPINGTDKPFGLQEFEAPKICRQTAYEGGNVGRPTHRPPLTPGDIPSTHFCYRLSRPHGHISSRYISVLSSQLRLILPDCLFPSAFGIKILYAFLFSHAPQETVCQIWSLRGEDFRPRRKFKQSRGPSWTCYEKMTSKNASKTGSADGFVVKPQKRTTLKVMPVHNV